MAISINKQPVEIQKQIIQDYKNGKSMRQIEKDYNTTRITISRFLEKEGIKTTKGNHYRIYHHQEDFFEIIDNEKKAYWLGFMYADGYIVDNSQRNRYGEDEIGIGIDIKDDNHLKKFLADIKATNSITYDLKNGRHMARVLLTSQKTANDLIDKGCFKQKTFILQPPTKVPNNLLPHFIRGFFDGDGSISKSGGKYYEQYHHYRYIVSFSCLENIAIWLKEYFSMGSIIKDKRGKLSYTYVIGGNNNIEKFYNIIYKDATVFLDRKYERFQEFLNQKYSESQGN